MHVVRKRGWTKGVCARDSSGRKVKGSAIEATAWCLYGARQAVYEGRGARRWSHFDFIDVSVCIQRALLRSIWEVTLQLWKDEVEFNDSRNVTCDDVLRVVERAQRVAGLQWPMAPVANGPRRRRKSD
jgi:hypothetical protein